MPKKTEKPTPKEAIRRFMEFYESYDCQITYRRDGKDADAEDGILEEFRAILAPTAKKAKRK